MLGYHVPKFPHSSATFNIILGSRILASPEVPTRITGQQCMPYTVQSTIPNASQ